MAGLPGHARPRRLPAVMTLVEEVAFRKMGQRLASFLLRIADPAKLPVLTPSGNGR